MTTQGPAFEGRVALVTGASRGIGLAIAQRLVDGGARVCLTARKPEGLADAVASLGGEEHAMSVAGKADDPDHREQAVSSVLERFGRLDILVNNVGINPSAGMLMDIDLAAARKTVEVNLIATLGFTQLAHRAWLREHGGTVLNVASFAGLSTSPGIAFYGSTKAAIINLTRQLALELAPSIRVNALAPAIVRTRFAEALYHGYEEQAAAAYPLKRLGEPEDVSAAAAFLLSDEAAWITGQTLAIDGGLLLGLG
jgi:3-oxoacyl-[acyl-carrier protein] reductase